jgi:hypothetical protein
MQANGKDDCIEDPAMYSPDNDEPTAYDHLPEINSYDEIPAFENEGQEDEFWSTHTLGPGILWEMRRMPVSEALKELEEIIAKHQPPESPTPHTRAT